MLSLTCLFFSLSLSISVLFVGLSIFYQYTFDFFFFRFCVQWLSVLLICSLFLLNSIYFICVPLSLSKTLTNTQIYIGFVISLHWILFVSVCSVRVLWPRLLLFDFPSANSQWVMIHSWDITAARMNTTLCITSNGTGWLAIHSRIIYCLLSG